MPIAGQGAVPAAGSLYNELTALTRRAFVPRLFVQLYYASPSSFFMFGTSLKADGGISQITIPVQTQSMTQGQFVGYGGGINQSAVIPGNNILQFPLTYWVVPVPLPFGEIALQATEREISILRARMNDAYAVSRQNIARLQFTNNTGNALYPNSFVDANDDGTNVAVYGGLNRTNSPNTSLKGQYINGATWASGSSSVGGVGFKRSSMSAILSYITDNAGGEAPTFAVMNPADFATLNNDFIGAEVINLAPNENLGMNATVQSSFPNLKVAGIPIFADHFVPKGLSLIHI